MIIYFSGTGNSRFVAEKLGSILGDNVFEMLYLTDELLSEKRIIWVFPTYSWGVPPIVKNVISKINIDVDCVNYMVTTCGDDIGDCHKMWRRLMAKRGYKTSSTFSVIMPNTYVCMKGFNTDSSELCTMKVNNAITRIDDIANVISTLKFTVDDVTRGRWAWIKTNIIYPYFVRFCMNPKKFRTLEHCNHCGKCSMECPLGNIKLVDNKPVWGDNCAFCLRCYHTCPKHAVDYDNATKGKGQYIFRIRYKSWNFIKKD